jgi:hypothetical protein
VATRAGNCASATAKTRIAAIARDEADTDRRI